MNKTDYLSSIGPVRLNGSVTISGSKNASLPLLASCLLFNNQVRFEHIPHLHDIGCMLALLKSMGVQVIFEDNSLILNHENLHSTNLPIEIASKIRGSILFLGPLLARYGHIRFPLPGGCAIGSRPIDFHIQALEALGARFEIYGDYLEAFAPSGLKGCQFKFPKPSVTGVENMIMAATLAQGTTIIDEAALDTEVDELIRFLNISGAKIARDGTRIVIEGTPGGLSAPPSFKVASDRMECGTFLVACGLTQGRLEIETGYCPGLEPILDHLDSMGMRLHQDESRIVAYNNQPLRARSFTTAPHPGFPTDLQAPFMALNCISLGESVITETIFENRFAHALEFLNMGAQLRIDADKVYTQGRHPLVATHVTGQDLRGTCSLALLSLVAQGRTLISNPWMIERGYEHFIEKMNLLGAKFQLHHGPTGDIYDHITRADDCMRQIA